MKIAILGTRGIPAIYGGFETFAEELAVRLIAKGVESTVYCIAIGEQQPETYKRVRLVYQPALNLGPLTTIVFDILCLWHARNKYDVVYMLGYGSSPFCIIPRLWGCTVWINMDGLEWKRAKWGSAAKLYLRSMEAIAMRAANRIIADASGIKKFLQDWYESDTLYSVIPYGATVIEQLPDPRPLAEWSLNPGHYYLVVCRLESENHVLEIIRGYRASKSTVPLVIIGNHRTDTKYVHKLLAERDKRIHFIGTVYEKEKLQVLRYYCRAYFHGHSVGGTNPSLLEALGCGNTIIAHDNVFNREVAADAAIYFTDISDIPAIIDQIEEQDDVHRVESAARARKRIQDRYTWERVTEAYLHLFREENKIRQQKRK